MWIDASMDNSVVTNVTFVNIHSLAWCLRDRTGHTCVPAMWSEAVCVRQRQTHRHLSMRSISWKITYRNWRILVRMCYGVPDVWLNDFDAVYSRLRVDIFDRDLTFDLKSRGWRQRTGLRCREPCNYYYCYYY